MKVIEQIPVHASQNYTVTVGQNLLQNSGEWLAALHTPCTVALVTDDTVNRLYADWVEQSLAAAGFMVHRFVFLHGEASKSTATLVELMEFLASHALTRTDLVAALGGGVVSDMAGFAAAVYLRGIPHVTIPTTLLAAVDAAVGGKTGVDLAAGKNLMGAFKQPLGVLCDTDTFLTLPPRELQNGMAEAIKTAVLSDSALFDQLANAATLTPDGLSHAVACCIRYKARIVEEDEHDNGCRQLLNFGHTIGHAIEQQSVFSLAHGQAVSIGMALITRAAVCRGLCDSHTADRLVSALTAHGLPTTCPYSPEELTAVALHDKKRRGNTLTLVLPERIGQCRLHDIPVDTLREWIAQGGEG